MTLDRADDSPRVALWWLFGATVFTGAGLAMPAGAWSALHLVISNLALGFLPFLWYCRDSDLHHFPRTIWWNMGMVALLFPVLFIYLWRSRGKGRRLRAVGSALACVPALLLASALGTALAWLLTAAVARL